MEKPKKQVWIVAFLILLIGIGIYISFRMSPEKEDVDFSDEIVPEEKMGEREEVKVSGYHLVTYEQSANTNSFIQSLEIEAVNDGKVRFVIGSIDSNSLVQERFSFEIACQKGLNTFELQEERYFVKEGEYVFMDVFGQDVLYKQPSVTTKSLVQNQENKVSGKMIMTQSDFILPFKYTLAKAEEYNVLAIGNDITMKNGGKGMAATEENNDYFSLTKNRLKNTFEKVNMNRVNAMEWEKSGTRKDWINTNLKKEIIGNLDLVIFQLGDNYKLEDDFEAGVTELVEFVREYSPNAEMIWIGVWDVQEKIMNSLPGICERLGIKFVNISDLAIEEYQSLVTENSEETFYPNNEAMQIISNRIMETLKFSF